MTEREIDYDKSRVEYEFFDKSAETFSVRLIALPNTEILTCAKKDITTVDKEDGDVLEIFLKDRKFRMGYAGTIPGTRASDILLLDAWCGTGTGGGGGGGDATAANQVTQSNLLTEIRDQQTDGTQKTEVTNFPATQAISASALPLPSGAATSANQTLQITQETAINTVLGTQADAAAGTDIANASQISLFKRLLQRVTTLIADSTTALANWTTLFNRIPASLTSAGNLKVSVQEVYHVIYGAPTVTNLGNVSQQIIAANPNRKALIFVNPSAGVVTVNPTGAAAVNLIGITVPANSTQPLIWSGEDMPTGALFGVRSAGTNNFYVFEGV